MKNLKQQLYHQSRSRSFLWKLGIGTVLAGVVLGFFAGFVSIEQGMSLEQRINSHLTADPSDFGMIVIQNSKMTRVVFEEVGEALESREAGIEELLIATPSLRRWISPEDLSNFEDLLAKHLSGSEVELVHLFMRALGTNQEDAYNQLEEMADREPAVRFTNQILGQLANSEKRYDKAYPHFRKEGEYPDAKWAREQAVINRHTVKDMVALKDMANRPDYDDAFSPWIRAEVAVQNEDWLALLKNVLLGQVDRLQLSSFILATIAMLVWAIILLQLCQVSRFDNWTPVLCVIGLLLGILSSTPTLTWVMLEDKFLPISQGEDLLHNIVYYIATVGLREEVCKLLLFLPLAPILIKRGYHLEFILVASFVGLGFAYSENFGYLSSSSGTAATARFLTANFLHISLTGMCGLYFCRSFGTRSYSYNDFFYIFGIAIVAHGLYDALLVNQQLNDQGFLAMILYILFSRYYFKETHDLRERLEPVVSLSATMSFGVSLLTAVLLVYLSTQYDMTQAIQLAFGSFLGSAIILFMFFREFGETLTD